MPTLALLLLLSFLSHSAVMVLAQQTLLLLVVLQLRWLLILPFLLLLKALSPPLLPLPLPQGRLAESLPPLMPQKQLICAIKSRDSRKKIKG